MFEGSICGASRESSGCNSGGSTKKEIFGACFQFLVSVDVEFASEFQRLKDSKRELQENEADAIKQAAANQSIFLQMCFLPWNVSVEFASDF